MPRRRSSKCRLRNLSSILIAVFTISTLTVYTATSSAFLQQPEALRIINAGAEAEVTVLGGAADDHLSGNGSSGDFSSLIRARAITTGDFNNDGVADTAVGAADADVEFSSDSTTTTIPDTGAVFVIFGQTGITGSLDVADTAGVLRITGPRALTGSTAAANFGFALASGDVNGDNIADLIVGAPGDDFPGVASTPQRNDTGAVYVFRGSASLAPGTLLQADDAAHIFFGVAGGDRFGSALAAGNVGGLNSSSAQEQAIADILAGAPLNDAPSRTNSGAGYVLFGSSTIGSGGAQPGVTDLAATPANVIILGRDGDMLGASAAIGDVNSGNLGDVLLGAPFADRPLLASPTVAAAVDTGAVFGVFGGANLNPSVGTSRTFDIAVGQQNLSIYGGTTSDRAGFAVAAGDVSGDGIPDILVGAPDASAASAGTRVNAGEAYVFAGGSGLNPSTGSETRLDIALNAFTLRVLGGNPGDHVGSTVAAGSFNTAGNVDNIPDFLIGAPGFDSRRGAVAMIFGGPSLIFLPTRDLFLGQDDIRVLGAQSGNLAGRSLRIRQTLTTQDTTVQPVLEGLVAALTPAGGDFPVTEDTDVQFNVAGSTLSGATVRGTGAAARLELENNPALQFDGTNDFVQVVNSGPLRPAAGSWTVEFWISRSAAGTGDFEPIISSRPFTGLTALGWAVGIDPGTGKAAMLLGDGSKGVLLTSTSTVSATPEHWSVVFDRTGSQVIFHKNGAIDAALPIPAVDLPGPINQADPVVMGSDTGASGTRFLNALLDDLRVWNIARTQPQISADFKKELAGSEANLVAYWKFNEAAGSTAIDSSALGNTGGNAGTINGATRTTMPNRFVTFGRRISKAYAFPSANLVSSQIDWSLITPAGTTLTVETSVDNGATWQLARSSSPIPSLSTGDELGWAIAAGDVNSDSGGDLIVGAPFATVSVNDGPRAGAGIVYVLPSTELPAPNRPPVVAVTQPNGGDNVQSNTTFNITWTASDPDGDATIQSFEVRLSTDAGATFNTIIASGLAGSARQFPWNVPTGLNSSQARIRVIVRDNQGATAQDESNANFVITDVGAPVTLLAPNGGERLTPGQSFLIRWDVPVAQRPLIRGYDVFLSVDDGTTFPQKLALGSGDPAVPALGPDIFSFNWQVGALCTMRARVSVIATTLTGVRTSDASNASFTIANPGPTVDTTAMAVVPDLQRIRLVTSAPVGGSEIVFSADALVELSNDADGTQFFTFSKPPKVKRQGSKLLTRGTINGQDLLNFFPDGATRMIRITNPNCAITILRVRRAGEQLLIAAPPGLTADQWQ